MPNRIIQKFAELHSKNKKALIIYITAGDPRLRVTEQLVSALERAGVDIVELGIPFSDPLADGPTIQAASQRALLRGVSLEGIFQSVVRIRKESQIPLALMSYYNPIFHYGEEKFVTRAIKVGVDGLIIPDLPPEEAQGLIRAARKVDLATVFFMAPTTTLSRMRKIAKFSTGFIYYVSLTGVTGARDRLAQTIASQVRQAKRLTHTPICVGFGVSTPQQVRSIARWADGVIIGSALIKEIEKNKKKPHFIPKVSQFVQALGSGLT